MKAYIVFSVLLFYCCQNASSQATRSDPTDLQGWFSTTLALDLPKKWATEFDYQARVFNNLNTFNGSYYSIDIAKKINRFFAATVAYRLAKVLKGTYNRYSVGVTLDKKWKATKTDVRILYQNQIQDFDDPANETDKDNYIRVRFRLRQPLHKNVSLFLSVEPIYQITPSITIDNYRLQSGLRFAIRKQLAAELFYINRPDYAKSYKRQYHIVGAGIQYEVKVKNSKGKL